VAERLYWIHQIWDWLWQL